MAAAIQDSAQERNIHNYHSETSCLSLSSSTLNKAPRSRMMRHRITTNSVYKMLMMGLRRHREKKNAVRIGKESGVRFLHATAHSGLKLKFE